MKNLISVYLLSISTLVAVTVAGCSSIKHYPIDTYNEVPCDIVSAHYSGSTRFVNVLARSNYLDLISGKKENLFIESLSRRRAAERQVERCSLSDEKLTEAAQKIIDKFSY
jgi:hypothetical protein